MAHGTRLFGFNCTACGHCCRHFRVPVTDADVRRLNAGIQPRPFAEWLEWMTPSEVDMTGEPETFVELPVGRRLLVLRHVENGCVFLQDNRCTLYASRPRSCRLYPWDVQLGRRGGVRRLKLIHQFEPCEATFDASVRPAHLAEQKWLERRELAAYVAKVMEWNRVQRRRQRLGKPLLTAEAFLAQIAR